MLFSEPEGVEVVGCGEDPGAGGVGCRGIGEEPERTARGDARCGVWRGDEDGLVGEGKGEVGEGRFESVVGEWGEADKKVARYGSEGFMGDIDVGLSGDHRVVDLLGLCFQLSGSTK